MSTVEFSIDLTVPDNTAFTVLTALKGLGYPQLERVSRSDLLRLHLGDASMSPSECGRALLHAEVVFNPNKHRLSYATDARSDAWEAVVEDKIDDLSALEEVLASLFGIRGLERVERATSWQLFEKGAPAGEERLTWACGELLANPISQIRTVRRRPVYESVE